MGVHLNSMLLGQNPIQGLPKLSPATDAFGRTRVSEPVGLFASQAEYDDLPLIFDEVTSGTGSSTHLPDESAIQLDVGTASGDRILRRTFQHIRYQPSKSQEIFLTFVPEDPKANLQQNFGVFDDNDGAFFRANGTTLQFVIRTSTSGSPVNNAIDQANWNLDKLDGSGPSGVTLDASQAQILWMDLEWLGVGQVRFGFVIDGRKIVCHEQAHANNIQSVYMRTLNLPVSYELINTDTTASASTAKMICCSVSSEGGFETDRAYQFAQVGAGITAGVTPTALLAIRQKNTFNSIPSRGQVLMDHLEVLTTSNGSGIWALYYIPHVGGSITGGAWVSVGTHSICEYNSTMTAFAGGIVVDAGFYSSTNQAKTTIAKAVNIRAPIIYDEAGSAYSAWLLASYAFTGTLVTYGSLTWKEIR